MKYKYIIDSPYEGKFILTDARDGNSHEITEKTAKCIFNGVSSHETFFSAVAKARALALECATVS
jgi:hypothetical protein